MSTRASKTPPNPSSYGDLRQWAASLADYLSWQTDIRQPVEPKAVLLAHKLNDVAANTGLERAGADGLLMFDPVTKSVVLAEGGKWWPLYAGSSDPAYGLGMHWDGPYILGNTYDPGSVVRDGEWTMIAVNETSDRPAPQAVGDPYNVYDGTEPTATYTAQQIVFGADFTDPDNHFWITGYRIYVVAGNQYEILQVRDPDGAGQATFVNSFTAPATGWREFGLVPVATPAGTKVRLLAIVNQPDPAPVETVANYNYATPTNTGLPGSGVVQQSTKNPEFLRFNVTDADGTDRTALLLGLQVGDKISTPAGTRTTDWSVQSVIDRTSTFNAVDVYVAPALQNANGPGLMAFTFAETTEQPVTVMEDVDYWLGNTKVRGQFIEDGSYQDVVESDNAYGVDLIIQEAYISPDWQVVATGISGSASDTAAGPLILHGETAIATAATASVSFPVPFGQPPTVTANAVGIGAANETKVVEVDNITVDGFDVRITMVDSAFSAPVRVVAGTINWTAIGDPV